LRCGHGPWLNAGPFRTSRHCGPNPPVDELAALRRALVESVALQVIGSQERGAEPVAALPLHLQGVVSPGRCWAAALRWLVAALCECAPRFETHRPALLHHGGERRRCLPPPQTCAQRPVRKAPDRFVRFAAPWGWSGPVCRKFVSSASPAACMGL
jgi:hypothetical protein